MCTVYYATASFWGLHALSAFYLTNPARSSSSVSFKSLDRPTFLKHRCLNTKRSFFFLHICARTAQFLLEKPLETRIQESRQGVPSEYLHIDVFKWFPINVSSWDGGTRVRSVELVCFGWLFWFVGVLLAHTHSASALKVHSVQGQYFTGDSENFRYFCLLYVLDKTFSLHEIHLEFKFFLSLCVLWSLPLSFFKIVCHIGYIQYITVGGIV